MKRKLFFLFFLFINHIAQSQTRLVMNGGNIVIQNGAYLVVPDGNPNAITIYNVLGGIIMNDAASRIRWHIGATPGNYVVPYFFSGTYIPFSFGTSGAVGSGYVDLGTYATPTWKNSDFLPPGVTNVNHNGVDNSNHVIDRFWSLDAGGFITKPSLDNVIISYRDAEWNAAGNAITEGLLKAQRWNSSLGIWGDFAPAGSANTTSNVVVVPTVPPSQLFQWWTLVDASTPLPLQLLSFRAYLQEKKVKLDWTTTSEVNTKEFVVQRSADRVNFISIDTVAAAGNSSTQKNYSTIDPDPLKGVSYYRLKMIDIDGQFKYSNLALIVLSYDELMVYPNPSKDMLFVNLGNVKADRFTLYDAAGKMVRSGKIINPAFSIDVSLLTQGTYWLQINTNAGPKNISIIKQE